MCSIAGVIALKRQDPETILDYAQLLGLFLQHRGHEWVGVAHSSGDFLEVEKLPGLVSSLFGNARLVGKMLKTEPQMMLMQTRFSTQGDSTKRNAQPHYSRPPTGIVALGSNGDIFDYPGARQGMQDIGCQMISQNDSEVLLHHILHHSQRNPETYSQGIRHLMANLPASFSSWLATDDQVWLFRDPHGNRPFYWMIVGDCFIFASEDCALHGILNSRASQGHRDGLVDINQVLPGQIINIKLHSSITYPTGMPAKDKLAHCTFCDVYFARPDSYVFGTPGEANNEQLCYQVLMEWNGDQPILTIPDNLSSVVSFRYRLGKQLAVEAPAEGADCAISVPSSGDPAAQGFAHGSNLPFEVGLIRSQYVARTFISPGRGNREGLATIKYQPVRDLFRKV